MKIIRYLDSTGATHAAAAREGDDYRRIEGPLFGDHAITDEPADVQKLLAPVEATSILCIGLNYRKHAEESGIDVPDDPILFVKGPNALQNPEDPIWIPKHMESTQVDYECELAVVIGKRCKNATRENALDYVLGYTCANDVSARDWQLQRGGGQWCRGKFFDTFALYFNCTHEAGRGESTFTHVPRDLSNDVDVRIRPEGDNNYSVSPYPFRESPVEVSFQGRFLTPWSAGETPDMAAAMRDTPVERQTAILADA